MAYDSPNIPSGREVLAKYNRIQLRHFKLSNINQSLELTPLSLIPWITARNHADSYSKTRFDSIDSIKKNDEFDSFIWHTTAQKVKEATRWGITKTQSITSQVISALGQYRLITLDRIEDGLISNRYDLKIQLLNHYQDRFEALQTLEKLANRNGTEQEFREAFENYIVSLIKLYDKLKEDFAKSNFDKVNEQGLKRMHAEIYAEIAKAQNFREHYHFESSNRATGVDSILTFVKTVMLRNLREMQNHNQNITYSRKMFFAATRGDLNSCIEGAVKVIRDYNASPRDSIDTDHQGLYGEADEAIAYDSSFHCTTRREARRAALAITFIEEKNVINLLNLKIAHATKWEIGGGIPVATKRLGAWIVNISIKFFAGIIELPLTVVIEPLTFGYASAFFQAIRKLATFEISVVNPQAPTLAGKDILENMQATKGTLGLRVRHFAKVAFKNTFQDIFFGVKDVYKQFTMHLFDEIDNDYADGEKKIPELSVVLKSCKHEFITIAKSEADIWKNVFPNKQKEEQLSQLTEEHSSHFAAPEFIPSVGEYDDALSASPDALEKFMEFFMHNIHDKHPATGLLFTLTYIFAGLAVVAPSSVAFLGAQYLAFCQAMGYSMSKGPLTAGISSAVTQAQIVSSSYEMLLHGHKSWIVSSAIEFEKDPFTTTIYVATAVGFGYVVVYQLHIPWLSDMFKEDMGSFPPTSLAFVGGKLGVLVYELFAEHHHLELEHTDGAKKIREYLTELYKKGYPTITDPVVIKGKVEEALTKLLNRETLTSLKETHSQMLARNELIQFLANNRKELPHLSAQTKHQLFQQVRIYFSKDQAKSLKKMLYPEETASIFRTTLKVMISYPAFIVRLAAAAVSSIRQHNTKPLQSASEDFGFKILKDLTRVGRASGKVLKTTSMFFYRHGKISADVFVNSFLGRGQALLFNRHHIANAGYAVSATCDAGFEMTRQFLGTPMDAAIKTVAVADPIDTERKVQISYINMIKKLGNLPIQELPTSSEELKSIVNDETMPEVRSDQVVSLDASNKVNGPFVSRANTL